MNAIEAAEPRILQGAQEILISEEVLKLIDTLWVPEITRNFEKVIDDTLLSGLTGKKIPFA